MAVQPFILCEISGLIKKLSLKYLKPFINMEKLKME